MMRSADDARHTHDGDIDCEIELSRHIRVLVQRAVAAGWTEEEVANALLSYAQQMVERLADEAELGGDKSTPRTIQ